MNRLCLLAWLLPSPALAGTWTAPEGCKVYVTVQSRSCMVSHHYRCQQDPAGDQRRVDLDPEGEFFHAHIDAEGQWLESIDTTRETLDPAPADPASMTDLLTKGIDTQDFQVSRDDGTGSRFFGSDRLNGKEVVIDGVTLLQIEADYTEYDRAGNVVGRQRTTDFIHPGWRQFFFGVGQVDLGDGLWRLIDATPVDFIFPGEDGFLALQPKYDCDALTAGLSIRRARYEP